MKVLLFISLFLIGCNLSKIQPTQNMVSGKVIKIVDGDTYDILLNDFSTIRIRMAGIDAPEKGMPFSKLDKEFLSMLL